MVLRIKNMVCGRCMRVVQEILTEVGVQVHHMVLGEVTIDTVNDELLIHIRTTLQQNGFELLGDRRLHLVENIKRAVIECVYNTAYDNSVNIIESVAEQVRMDSHSMSSMFSAHAGLTLEKFIIQQKLERVKDLLIQGTMTLSDIADLLGYSSVAHLSAQFRKVVGISATEYKRQMRKNE